MGIDRARHLLAKWRREGKGIWYITFIIEGYDEEFHHLLPGRHSRRAAVKLGRFLCANEQHEKQKHVHLVSAERRT